MNKIIQMQDADGNNIFPVGFAQGGVKMDLLWTNPNPSTAFAPQTITLDLSSYSLILITSIGSISANSGYGNNILLIDSSIKQNTFITAVHNNVESFCRRMTVDNQSIVIETGYEFSNAGESASTSVCIPYKIYGIKTSYVVPTEVHGLTYLDDDVNGNITLYNNDGTKALHPKGQLLGIDTSRLLATYGDTTFEYTATEDCFVCSKNVNVYINGVIVEDTKDCYIIPLKKGQTFSTTTHSYSITYIYGAKN